MTEEKKVRMKKSANYVLEQMLEQNSEQMGEQILWRELKDGFISPKKVLEWAESNKVQGAVRAVRIASPVYGGSVVTPPTPDPIYTLKRIDVQEKPKPPRKARKSRKEPVIPVESTEQEESVATGDQTTSFDVAIPPEPEDLDATP